MVLILMFIHLQMQSEFFETVNLLNTELEQCHQELRSV